MAVGIFIVPYTLEINPALGPSGVYRTIPVNDFNAAIAADGGAWRESEFLGNRMLVVVRASATTLNAIGARGWFRFPVSALDNTLASLTNTQRTAIRNQITGAGYTLAELNAAHPDLAQATLRQALTFLLRRRLRPRFDVPSQQVICDGAVQSVVPVEWLEEVATG